MCSGHDGADGDHPLSRSAELDGNGAVSAKGLDQSAVTLPDLLSSCSTEGMGNGVKLFYAANEHKFILYIIHMLAFLVLLKLHKAFPQEGVFLSPKSLSYSSLKERNPTPAGSHE